MDFSNEGGGGGDDGGAGHGNDGSSFHATTAQQGYQAHQNGYGYASAAAAAAAAAQPAAALPPLPPGKDIPPGASATDEISRILRTLPPTQLLDILAQMKTLAGTDPARATELLAQAPQLAYAIFQALLLMDLVSPDAINSVVEGVAAGGAGQQQQQQQRPALPVQQATPVPPAGLPYQYPGAVGTPPVVAGVGGPYAPPPPPSAEAAGVTSQNPDELIKQVLALPQSMIDQLPEAERTQLMALRAQYGRR